MKRTFTTRAGAGEVAATFLFGGSAVGDSAHPRTPNSEGSCARKDPFQACLSGGGNIRSCCAQVGGWYKEETYINQGPGGNTTTVKESCLLQKEASGGPRSPIVKPGEGSISS